MIVFGKRRALELFITKTAKNKENMKNTKLIKLRLSLGLTQLQAAKIFEVDRTTYQMWEYGRVQKPKNFEFLKFMLLKYKNAK